MPRVLARPLILLLTLLAGCGLTTSSEAPRELTVLAASSLTDAFRDLERRFEAEHPTVDVVLAFAGSQTLATQLRNGMHADVFASASARHADQLATEGLVEGPRPFATNRLVLALHTQTPANVDLEHLGSVDRIVLGTPQVPVGEHTLTLLDRASALYGQPWRAGVEARVVSREPSVRRVLAKVDMGEADAAVVYRTDAATAKHVRAVELPPSLQVPTTSVHAAVTGSALAPLWLDFVDSSAGQAVLHDHGFGTPEAR